MPKFRTGSFAKTETALPEVAEQVTTAKPKRANKFAARCTNCGQNVPEGAGSLDKVEDKWVVSHFPACPDQTLTVAQPATEQASPTIQQTVVNGEVVFDGIYTVETATGHRTFRLRTQGTEEDFMPGVQIVQYLGGADNEHDYTSFGHVRANRVSVWKRHQGNQALVDAANAFFADPHAALKSTNCYACGRTLTVPSSVHNGLGPECSKKGF